VGKQGALYAVTSWTLVLPSYVFVLWGEIPYLGDIPSFSPLMALMVFVTLGFVLPRVWLANGRRWERLWAKSRNSNTQVLVLASRNMASVAGVQSVLDKVIVTIQDVLGAEEIALFLAEEPHGSFRIKGSRGWRSGQQDSVLDRIDPLVCVLLERMQIVSRVQVAEEAGSAREVARRMEEMDVELSVPLICGGKLLGMVNLGNKRDGKAYEPEEVETLSLLANQAAAAIENQQLYENLRQARQALQRMDRLAALGTLTAGLAHEIRNPLVAIKTFTQLLPERYGDLEFRESFKALALKEVDRICGLVNDLLNFARPPMPDPSLADVNEVVAGMARMLQTEAKKKGVRMKVELGDVPKILLDRGQVEQVIMNVILNAIQSIAGEGEVDVATGVWIDDGGRRMVRIEVKDNGTGIAEKDVENIFHPFYTTKSDGSGLGLSISNHIVQEHGGYILVESKVGEGTRFLIDLPVDRKAF